MAFATTYEEAFKFFDAYSQILKGRTGKPSIFE